MVLGSDLDELYLVMEYAGRSLYDEISSRHRHGRPFSESEARSAMAQLLTGASTMHAHRIIHRDLKPGNVLVSKKHGLLVLKICDLGLANSWPHRHRPRTWISKVRLGTWPRVAHAREGLHRARRHVVTWLHNGGDCNRRTALPGGKLLPAIS